MTVPLISWTVYVSPLTIYYLEYRTVCFLYQLYNFVEISANVYNLFFVFQTFSEAIPILVANVIVHLDLSKRSLRLGEWVHKFGSCRIFFETKKSRFLRNYLFEQHNITCLNMFLIRISVINMLFEGYPLKIFIKIFCKNCVLFEIFQKMLVTTDNIFKLYICVYINSFTQNNSA